MINGKTRLLGVIGDPVTHSISPLMQNAALKDAKLNFVYLPLAVKPDGLQDAVLGMRALNFRGFNVTIPYKHAIIPHLDKITKAANLMGAVNTVLNDNGTLIGYNTDYLGFISALDGHEIAGKKAVVMGAGGAARSIIWGLYMAQIEKITVLVRNRGKANKDLEDFIGKTPIYIQSFDGDNRKAIGEADFLINATSVGMEPHTSEMPPVDLTLLKPSCVVYDIIYTPKETKFLKEAKALGHTTINGEKMLVGQGAEAFLIWTDQEANKELMQEVLEKALSKGQN